MTIDSSSKRTRCNVCDYSDNILFCDLGLHPLADTFLTKQMLDRKLELQPLVVNKCNFCGHFFLGYETSPFTRYQAEQYSYTTANSEIALAHFSEFADEVINFAGSNSKVILDIGGNDGTLLKFFQNKTESKVINIEPSANICEISEKNNVQTINDFFNLQSVKKHSLEADLIVSANVVNHIDNLNEMMLAVDYALQKDGKFVFQVPYVGDLINNRYFETIYHEHVNYFSVSSASAMLNKHGFKISRITFSDYMCGSMRIYAERSRNNAKQALEIQQIKKIEYDTILANEYMEKFNLEIQSLRHELRTKIASYKSRGFDIFGFSAATKANTLLNFCGITFQDLSCVLDTSDLKIGKYMPKSSILIHSEKEMLKVIEKNSENVVAIILAENLQKILLPKLRNLGVEIINWRDR